MNCACTTCKEKLRFESNGSRNLANLGDRSRCHRPRGASQLSTPAKGSRVRTSTVQKEGALGSIDAAQKLRPIEPWGECPVASEAANATIVLIEKRALFRDCLTRCLRSAYGLNVLAVASVEDWLAQSKNVRAALVVLSTPGRPRDEVAKQEIAALAEADRPLPTVVLSDMEDTGQIVEALDQGVRGYIPTNMTLDVAVEAMRLVRAGGTFVPASSLVAAQRRAESSAGAQRSASSIFTARQAAVVEALRMGKANKLIAYELNMCESTVKVHVRNIMKKLKAKNRTQVAFIANELLRRNGA